MCILFFTTFFSYIVFWYHKRSLKSSSIFYIARDKIFYVNNEIFHSMTQKSFRSGDKICHRLRKSQVPSCVLGGQGSANHWRAPCLCTTSLSDKKAAASRNSPSSSPPHLHLHNFIFLILYWYRSGGIQIKNHRSITGPSFLCNTNFSIN